MYVFSFIVFVVAHMNACISGHIFYELVGFELLYIVCHKNPEVVLLTNNGFSNRIIPVEFYEAYVKND